MKRTLFLLSFLSIFVFGKANAQLRLGLTAHPNFGFLKVENGKKQRH
jgi:hypothetical protein